MQVYIVCPVRNSTPADQKFALDYVAGLERQGITVYFPPRDSDQTEDGIGLRVNEANRAGLLTADEVHVIWDPKSIGSHFDMGMVFMLRAIRDCAIVLVNPVERTATKSYTNVVLELARK